eukprot:comp25018_c0_seq1/m.46940 comp25018_c0_seq1/g.46940  ORF comp25018_c0_seq1/g.46940 comp25018_c0_seq1/m.46940 type:complete len:123 (-) comp25018_c0_seq1:184-552(-)
MVVRLRLQRFGHRHRPFYNIVAADARSKRDGKCIEKLGTYDPLPTEMGNKLVTIKAERVKYWMAVGAQPTDKVRFLLGQAGILPTDPNTRAVNVMKDQVRQFEEKVKAMQQQAPPPPATPAN